MLAMDLIKPPALRKGDTIGIVAPSSLIESDKLDAGVSVLRDYGFNIQIHPQTLARDRQSAGTPQEKAAALHEMFMSPEIKAIIGARGGNGSCMVLDQLDFGTIRANPKIYMGFSDSTALQGALWTKAGLTSVHGPFLKGLPTLNPACVDHAFALLAGKTPSYPLGTAKVLRHGEGEGPLFGGTLSMLSSSGWNGIYAQPQGRHPVYRGYQRRIQPDRPDAVASPSGRPVYRSWVGWFSASFSIRRIPARPMASLWKRFSRSIRRILKYLSFLMPPSRMTRRNFTHFLSGGWLNYRQMAIRSA